MASSLAGCAQATSASETVKSPGSGTLDILRLTSGTSCKFGKEIGWNALSEELTADTISDEQILRLRRILLRESNNQFTCDTDACGDALRDYSDSKYDHVRDTATIVRRISRERCAEIMNERRLR